MKALEIILVLAKMVLTLGMLLILLPFLTYSSFESQTANSIFSYGAYMSLVSSLIVIIVGTIVGAQKKQISNLGLGIAIACFIISLGCVSLIYAASVIDCSHSC